jgi:hypothetical protein
MSINHSTRISASIKVDPTKGIRIRENETQTISSVAPHCVASMMIRAPGLWLVACGGLSAPV